MARTKLTIRQIQEILRLKHHNQLSVREIARSCGLPTSPVGDYLKRAEAAGIGWPSPDGQGEKELLQLAEHYGTAIIPARSKKPCDKAKVEAGVQVAERQILAALRDQRFFNVGQLNAAIIRPDVRG